MKENVNCANLRCIRLIIKIVSGKKKKKIYDVAIVH